MSKKILTLLLAVVMLMVSGPLEAYAANEAVGPVSVTVEDYASDTADIKWDAVKDAAYYSLTLNEYMIETNLTDPAYKLTALMENTAYTVTVTAYDKDGTIIAEGARDFITLAANAPEKVNNFRTVSSYLSVVLKWDRSYDADGYRIYWKGNNKTSGTIDIDDSSKKSYTFKIAEDNREVKYTFRIVAVKDGVESAEVKKTDSAVQLMKLEVTLRVGKTLQNHDRPAGRYTIKLKAGTKIKTIGFTNGKYVFQKKVKGKLRTFHVMRVAVKNQKIDYIGKYKKSNGWKLVQPMYTKEEAESFVNTLGVKSNTKHLIWVNQYSQRIYVFSGKKGKWKLIKQCYKDEDDGHAGWMVASGKPTSPTSTGLTNIKQRVPGGGGKVPFWNVTSWFSIHGNSPGPWGPLGWPKSGACCRNTTPHAKWIYFNTKMHTAVYVY